jgi:hypothetical protein
MAPYTQEEIMKALIKALVRSTVYGGCRMPVEGVEGVAVMFGGESQGTPAAIIVTLPSGAEVTSPLTATDVTLAAREAAQFIGA